MVHIYSKEKVDGKAISELGWCTYIVKKKWTVSQSQSHYQHFRNEFLGMIVDGMGWDEVSLLLDLFFFFFISMILQGRVL